MAPQGLKHCVVVLSGTFRSNHSKLASDIKSHGGKYSQRVTKACTHLVASQDHYDTNMVKVKQAKEDSDIGIVSIDWLLDSLEAGARADESNYFLTDSDSLAKGDAEAEGDSKTGNDNQAENGAIAKAEKGKKRTRHFDSDESTSLDPKSEGQPPAKKIRDGQKAKSNSLQVPVDGGCDLAGSYLVYIDDDDVIYDAALTQNNFGEDNNMFCKIQLLKSANGDEWYTWTRWGRIGQPGRKKARGTGSFADAKKEFDKTFKDKTGHKWDDRREPHITGKFIYMERSRTYIERNDEEDSSDGDESPWAKGRTESKASNKTEGVNSKKPVESTLPKPIQRLMEFIFDQNNFAIVMAEMSYDANKLPLRKLSKHRLMAAFEKLKELGELFIRPAWAIDKYYYGTLDEAIEAFTKYYYSAIPHVFGRNRPPMIRDVQILRKETELVESLSNMEIANKIMKGSNKEDQGDAMHPLDRQFAGLGLTEMTPLSSTSNEYKKLDEYLVKTHGATHHMQNTHHMQMKVQDIFRIERNGESERFYGSRYIRLRDRDRRLLWHGSRSTNFAGILSQGLRVGPPEAPVNGYVFGKAISLADMSSKSAEYCVPGSSGNVGLLLLCQVELCHPLYQPEKAEFDAVDKMKQQDKDEKASDEDTDLEEEKKKVGNRHSTWAMGRIAPTVWKDAGCIHEELKGVMMPDFNRLPEETYFPSAFVQHNEYFAYDNAQIRMRYLFRVEMR